MTNLNSQEIIVVTGASSGIGAATAKRLAILNYHVLAGVLSENEARNIESKNIEPIVLDITKEQDIKRLADRLQSLETGGSHLRSLINNAGIEFNAPFELLPLSEWRKQFEVNLFGQVAITQRLIPFLRESKGTIVNITSVGGKVAMPNYAAYAATKFAFEAVSDSLRRELHDQGIKVAVVEPGGVQTKMAAYSGDLSLNFEKTMSDENKKLYSKLIKSAVASQSNFLKHAVSAHSAGNKIAKIATKTNPRAHYSLGMDAKMTLPLARFFPTFVVDWSLALSRRLAR